MKQDVRLIALAASDLVSRQLRCAAFAGTERRGWSVVSAQRRFDSQCGDWKVLSGFHVYVYVYVYVYVCMSGNEMSCC